MLHNYFSINFISCCRLKLLAVLGRYFGKAIYYLLLVTATAVKSVTVTYYLILKVTSNILYYILFVI